jgi:uncharacterized protein with NAD-binding domain and iron-sulfur cluster
LPQDFTQQKYLASMEGAVLSGKLCAKQINDLSRTLKEEDSKVKNNVALETSVSAVIPPLVVA